MIVTLIREYRLRADSAGGAPVPDRIIATDEVVTLHDPDRLPQVIEWLRCP